jgi:Fe-S-cluster containining protein
VSEENGGLRFECTACGKCCTTRGEYAYVYLNRRETRTLASHLDLHLTEFKRRYTFVDEDGWRQLEFSDGRCTFLDDAGRCGVYEARPAQCRTFPFWPEFVDDGEWTAEVRDLCEGVGRGPRYTLPEAGQKMFEFLDSEKE